MAKYKTGYFDIDHPILYWILTPLKIIICAIGIMFVLCLLMFLTILPQNNCYKGDKIFEYEDIDGNKGIAYHCQFSDADYNYKKGGQGQPICFVGNKVITVKWYEDKTEYGSCAKIIFDNQEKE